MNVQSQDSFFTTDMLKSTATYQGNKDYSSCEFSMSDIAGFDFSASTLQGAVFQYTNLSDVSFKNADLTDVQFRSTNLTNADFTDAVITGGYFAIVDTSSPDDVGISFDALSQTKSYKDKNLSGISWEDYDFSSCEFADFNFSYGGFEYTDFQEANLSGADFSYSSITDSDLRRADLSRGVFTGANLRDLDLRGADLTGATDFNPSQYERVIAPDGSIADLGMASGRANLYISKDAIDASIDYAATVSNRSSIVLNNQAILRLKSGADLTISDDSRLKVNSDTSSYGFTGIKLDQGSSLTLDEGAIISINLYGDDAVEDFQLAFLQVSSLGDSAMHASIEAALQINDVDLASSGYELFWDEASMMYSIIGDYSGSTIPVPPVVQQYETTSANSTAGARLLSHVNPSSGDLHAVLASLSTYAAAGDAASVERLTAAVAGAGVTSLGAAAIGSVEGRLQALRHQSPARLKPGTHVAWVTAEGNFSDMSSDGTMAGYDLDTWGGSVGADWAISEQVELTASFTALYGDLHADSVEHASGDLDGYYLAVAASYKQRAWQHRFVATLGLLDANLSRRVSYAGGSYQTQGDTDGYALGLMYELGYEIALSEDRRQVIEPIVNLTLVSTSLDAYNETGSDAALRVAEQSNTYMSAGVGARYRQQVTSALSISGYALVRFDGGDRQVDADVGFVNTSNTERVKGADPAAVGVELGLGAGYTLSDQSSIFAQSNIEMRGGDYTNVNATLGYRFSF